MGDLRRYEAQAATQNAGAPAIDCSRVAEGDLHRYDGQAAAQNAGAPRGDYVGMGDLRRYEALQEKEYAGEITNPSP